MFYPIDGGATIDIQGLPCSLARDGYIFDCITGKWINNGVHKRQPQFSECYWEPDPRWKKYLGWKAEQDKRQKQDPDFIHAQLNDFISDCWRWRLGGYWFNNNGVATYITGLHWYYLSCYHLDIGLPRYRDVDRQFFYAWQYVEDDPDSLGLNFVTKRRAGKTYIASCIGVEKATRTKNFNVGIQSKTDADAKALFLKAVVAPYRKLPYFFKPVSNLPAGKLPATALRFETGRMDTNSEDELNSMIDFKPSNAEAYDGQKLGYYIDDECGKCVGVNVADRWDIVKYCLRDDESRVIGKALHTTTVEEMEKGGREYLVIWNASNQKERNSLGRTNSGLFNYFTPAHYVRHIDQRYGIADHEKAYNEIIAERAAVTDGRAKSHMMRKEPLDEREAFSVDASQCIYDPIKLNVQYENLKYIPPMYRTGDLHWIDGIIDGKVEFVDNPNGSWKPAWLPPPEYQNLQLVRNGERYPKNTEMGCGGIDPYDHRLTKEQHTNMRTLSKGAVCFVKAPHPLALSDVDEGACMLYIDRLAEPVAFYEECIKACVLYGFKVLVEDNKDGCIKHFQDRGYGGYLAWLPPYNKPGIGNYSQSKGGGVNEQVAAATSYYIAHHMSSAKYISLIDDWLLFDTTDTTKFDGAMAFGFAKILQKTVGGGFQRAKPEKAPEVKSLLPPLLYADGGRTLFGY